jgi:hypothetical protein
MGALGYSKNKQPMLELAGRMPLQRLGAASGNIPDNECLARYQAYLLGMAGLLPSQGPGNCRVYGPGGDWLSELETLWRECREPATMSEDEWHFFKVRPGNYPTRRIAVMSHLLCRYRSEGILAGLLDRLGAMPSGASCRGVEELFLVAGENYPARGQDSGFETGHPALLGRERAGDIAVNVLLPFAVAWGNINARPGLAIKALDFYHRYPALARNTLEKHMVSQLGVNRYLVNSARRQQGLLHLYKNFCSQGRCGDCPLIT